MSTDDAVVAYPRCPTCGAVTLPEHDAIHRPLCPMDDTDPTTWRTP